MRFCLAVLLLAIVFALPAQAAAPAPAEKQEIESLRCPDSYKGDAFSDLDIFHGSPDARDYLMADEDGWDIQHNRAPGEKVYIACKYGKSGAEQLIEIPTNIDFCTPAEFNVDCR
jgi:hypothetical protein